MVHCFWRLPQGSFTAGWVAKRQTSRCNSRERENKSGKVRGMVPRFNGEVSFGASRLSPKSTLAYWHSWCVVFNEVPKTFQQFNIVDWNIHTLFDLGLLLPVGYGGLVYQRTLRPRTPWKIWTGIWSSWNTSEKTEELELEHVPTSKKKHKKDLQSVKMWRFPKIQVFSQKKKRSIQGGVVAPYFFQWILIWSLWIWGFKTPCFFRAYH